MFLLLVVPDNAYQVRYLSQIGCNFLLCKLDKSSHLLHSSDFGFRTCLDLEISSLVRLMHEKGGAPNLCETQ